MKRIGGSFDRIWDRDNLIAAVWLASRGKRLRRDVKAFESQVQCQVTEISDQIRRGTYRFDSYREFFVRDTKTRPIKAPTFRDRVVHHAIIRVTGPIFESGAIAQSYACRIGRGHHAALAQARTWTRRTDWYAKIDIRKFYDSVDHEILRRRLARRFRERRLLDLFDRLIESYQAAPGLGIPIGALTSQYFGNFYLDEFDARMRATGLCGRYVRYMDDVVIWRDQTAIAEIRASAYREASRLHLEVKHGGEWNRCVRGVPFLGFVIYPDRVRVGRQARKRLRRKFRVIRKRFADAQMSEGEYQARCTSLFAHVRHADDLAWRLRLLYSDRGDDCRGDMP